MTSITLPVILTIIGLVGVFVAYRGIRRGGARFYTLEREAMLRRASFTLLVSVLLLLSAIALLAYNYRQMADADAAESDETEAGLATATAEAVLETQPRTPTPTATADPNVPTVTPTPVICRAIVEGTDGSGLTLRDAPGGEEIAILPDGSILTLLEAEPVTAGGFTWRSVRTVAREEGWVAEEFLTIGDCR